MKNGLIYLDNAATTPVAPEVVEAMNRCFLEEFGNPSSSHRFGVEAERLVAQSRTMLAEMLSCKPEEVVFTSGGSEADNLAILGAAGTTRKRKLIVSAVEHPAVLESARRLGEMGFTVCIAPVDHFGVVDVGRLVDLVDDDTFLVSVMLANNETGTIQPVTEIAKLVKKKAPDVLVHTDAVQYFGKEHVSVADGLIDMLSLAGHKIHGPKGVGALYVKTGVKLKPLIYGGGQERGLRAGTENVPGVVGLAAAARLMASRRRETLPLLRGAMNEALELLRNEIPGLELNGHPDARLPHIMNIGIPGVMSQHLMGFLEAEGVIVSAGSACHSHSEKRSHVLEAMNTRRDCGTIRISASIYTTREDILNGADRIAAVVRKLRKGR